MEEIWKDIIGYDGQYQISNTGLCKSTYRSNQYGKTYRIFLIKPIKIGPYARYRLNRKWHLVHRLVAIHFIDNPLNLPCVCHKDETLDEKGMLYNGKDNLFWGTHKDNAQDRDRKGRSNNHFLKNHPRYNLGKKINKEGKLVNQYTINFDFIKTWFSIKQSNSELGIDRSSISKCCNGKQKTAGGFIWKFKNKI